MNAALEGGEWSAAGPGRTLHPGKTEYLVYRSLSGPQSRSACAKILVPIGIGSRTVQPVAQSLCRLSYPPPHTHIYKKERVVNAFATWSWRRMLKVKWKDTIMNDKDFQKAKEERLFLKILKTDATHGKGIQLGR